MKRYVLGFAIYAGNVLLIKKEKPRTQKGKLNGIGGKIEEGETSYTAMVREFREETGLKSKIAQWSKFAIIRGEDYFVHIFVATAIPETSLKAKDVAWYPIEDITTHKVVEDLTCLVPIAHYFSIHPLVGDIVTITKKKAAKQ